jgi:predicted dehydrogenase
LLTIQVDGTAGSAVAGLRDCRTQHRVNTPKAIWNPDIPNPLRFRDQWLEVPDVNEPENAFKAQWELFLSHIVCDAPFPWDLMEGAKGVQLAELARQSWQERRWVDVPKL